MQKMYLVLQNGQVFEGRSFGADDRTDDVVGEIVFTTAMTGYLESLTDPSYFGQVLVQTFPLIGNYGVIPEDLESTKVHVKAYVVREVCDTPSNYRCKGKLDDFLKQQGVLGICGIDTRALTEVIREAGVMNVRITRRAPDAAYDAKKDETLQNYAVKGAVAATTCSAPSFHPGSDVPGRKRHLRVALYDFGTKENIVRSLGERGCDVTVVPAGTPADEILHPQNGESYDGVMLSNGPGDPAENRAVIEEVRKLLGKIPLFGICLGHQILALAAGAETEKLKYGHRGANQPVKDLETGRIYITSQNHGYAVRTSTLPRDARLRLINVNDGTVEGIAYPNLRAFSVQYHPEACAGPHDSRYLFDEFVRRMLDGKEEN